MKLFDWSNSRGKSEINVFKITNTFTQNMQKLCDSIWHSVFESDFNPLSTSCFENRWFFMGPINRKLQTLHRKWVDFLWMSNMGNEICVVWQWSDTKCAMLWALDHRYRYHMEMGLKRLRYYTHLVSSIYESFITKLHWL